jgi:hypothetical protein
MPRLIRRQMLLVVQLVAMAVLWTLWPASAAADVPVVVTFDPQSGVAGSRVTVSYDPCNRVGGRPPGGGRILFSKSETADPPYLASAVLSLVREGSGLEDGVSSFVVPDVPTGHYYLLAQCGEELPCCALLLSEDAPWFTVLGAPSTDIASMPSNRKGEDPLLPVILGSAAAAGAIVWRRRVARR